MNDSELIFALICKPLQSGHVWGNLQGYMHTGAMFCSRLLIAT